MLIIKRWLPAAIVSALIFVFSSQSGASVSKIGLVDEIAHRLAHLAIYFVLCITFYRATKNVFLAFLLTLLYGISDEFHQFFVPTRSANATDIMVDGAAAALAGLILWKYFQNLPKKLKNWLLS